MKLFGFCTHGKVRVKRYHADTVPAEMKGKELYVDVFNVHNFVACSDCNKTFQGDQREKLFEQRGAD